MVLGGNGEAPRVRTQHFYIPILWGTTIQVSVASEHYRTNVPKENIYQAQMAVVTLVDSSMDLVTYPSESWLSMLIARNAPQCTLACTSPSQ